MKVKRIRQAALASVVVGLLIAPSTRAADYLVKVSTNSEPIAAGPYQPDWKSLEDQYQVPDWFRNAKFSIWAHWSDQCVPEHGDWYARGMYEEVKDDYNFQMAHYGHPSKVGFKDVDHMWHAENWDPNKLMDLYKRAGAKYFVALANHHDNFDCFDSKYQPWNSTKIGPMKDLVGGWAKAARDHGMRFGVSVHASHAWSWFEVSQCIFSTRAWTIYGEGPSAQGKAPGGGNFNEGKQKPLTAEDFRFTANGKTVYAIEMDWPSGGEMFKIDPK